MNERFDPWGFFADNNDDEIAPRPVEGERGGLYDLGAYCERGFSQKRQPPGTFVFSLGNIQRRDVPVFLEHMAPHVSLLQSLSILGSAFGDEGVEKISRALLAAPLLHTLILIDVGLVGIETPSLWRLIGTSTTLRSLGLQNNCAGYCFSMDLARALMQNTSLTSLFLSGTDLCQFNPETVIRAFFLHPRLDHLFLLDCFRRPDKGVAKAFAEGLAHNNVLRTLDMEGTCLSEQEWVEVFGSLRHNTTLRTLLVKRHVVGRPCALIAPVRELLKWNVTLDGIGGIEVAWELEHNAQRRVSRKQRCYSSAMAVIGLKQFRVVHVMRHATRDVIRLIARAIFATRLAPEWEDPLLPPFVRGSDWVEME